MKPLIWPEGKTFAFTIFDDTDLSVVGNFEATYAFSADCGFRTTKSVCPIEGAETPQIGGATCENPAYLKSVLHLQGLGFEIGYHDSTYHGVSRDQIAQALEKFRALFGHYPKSMSNH